MASLLEATAFEWPRDYLLVVCLQQRIVWMCLACLNYISNTTCSKVTVLTQVISWLASYMVRPLVRTEDYDLGPH